MLNIIQSFIAFAVTMLALSTLVTVLLEAASRLLWRRHRILKRMLVRVYEEDISPVLDMLKAPDNGTNNQDKKDLDTQAQIEFVNQIKVSPFQPEKDKNVIFGKLVWLTSWLTTTNSDQISREEFIRRFARSDMGGRLSDSALNAEVLVEQLGRTYDEMATGAREYMKNSSAVFSLLIGIFVALAMNIDASRLLQYYIDNPAVSQAVTNDADRFLTGYKDAQAKLAELDKNLQKGEDLDPNALAKNTSELKNLLGVLNPEQLVLGEGLPIGASYFPFCPSSAQDKLYQGKTKTIPNAVCSSTELVSDKSNTAWDKFTNIVDTVLTSPDGLWWFVKVIFTGILIGLGGPFWYDAVKGLMRVTQIMRGRTGAAPNDQNSGSETGTLSGSASTIFATHVKKPKAKG